MGKIYSNVSQLMQAMHKVNNVMTNKTMLAKLMATALMLIIILSLGFQMFLWIETANGEAHTSFGDLDRSIQSWIPDFLFSTALLLIVSVNSFIRRKERLLAGLALSMIAWIIISMLHDYYSIFNLKTVEIIGFVIAVISIGLYIGILVQKGID